MTRSPDRAAEARAHYEGGRYDDFLFEIGQRRIDCFAEPGFKIMVADAADKIVHEKGGRIANLLNFIAATKDREPNPSILLNEQTVAGALAVVMADDWSCAAPPKDIIAALKKTWGENESFIQDASACVALALHDRVPRRIAERLEMERKGAFRLDDYVVSNIKVLSQFPALLRQSHHPVAQYLEFDLARYPAKADVQSMKPEDLSAYFIKAGAPQKEVMKTDTEVLRETLLEGLEESPVLETVQSNPALLSQVKMHCLKHAREFPIAARRFGYQPALSSTPARP